MLLENLVKNYKIPLSKKEINKIKRYNTSRSRRYWIYVSNCRKFYGNGIDVDKFDYLKKLLYNIT